MRFHGRVRFGDVEDELDVAVEIDDTHVRFVSGDESLGSWCLADVVANRLVANEFEIDLDGETVVFLADDQVNFAYGAVQRMAEGWARYQAMNPVRRRRAVGVARRGREPSRFDEVRQALLDAREALVRSTPAIVIQPTPSEAPAAAPGAVSEAAPGPGDGSGGDGGGFWAKVERATAQETVPSQDPAIDLTPDPAGVDVPPDPSRHRVPRLDAFPRRPSPLPRESLIPERQEEATGSPAPVEAPAPWIKPAPSELDLTTPEPPPPPPPDREPQPADGVSNGAGPASQALVGAFADGHHPAETSGLRASMRSLFSRSKAPHDHSFVESTTAVGITRRVCLECGYVSIGVSEREA